MAGLFAAVQLFGCYRTSPNTIISPSACSSNALATKAASSLTLAETPFQGQSVLARYVSKKPVRSEPNPETAAAKGASMDMNSSNENIVNAIADVTHELMNNSAMEAQNPSLVNGLRNTVGIKVDTTFESGERTTSLCTGVVLANNLILTAAHCFVPETGKVASWEGIVLSGTNFEKALAAQKYPIDQIAVHPNWNGVFNDLALVSTKTALPRTHRIVPFVNGSSSLAASKGVYLVGFGNSELEKSDDEVMRYAESRFFNEVNSSNYKGISIVNQLRIKDDKSNAGGACQGDSGGPAYFKDTGKVLGIVSGMHSHVQGLEQIKSCRSGDVNYTFVAPYFSWIESVTGIKLEESQSVKSVEAEPLFSLKMEQTIRPENFVFQKQRVTTGNMESVSTESMDSTAVCK